MRKLVAFFVVALTLTLASSAAAATISGVIFVNAGPETQPGFQVKIVNASTGAVGSTRTDAHGFYQFGGIVAGVTYGLSVPPQGNRQWRSCPQPWSVYLTARSGDNWRSIYTNLSC